MPEKSITCPSGLTGRIRGLKGKELDLLGDKKAIRKGDLFDNLLRACWLETEDPGPYDFGSGSPNWSRVLVADRFYVLLQIRQTTYPDEPYSFRTTCADDNCAEPFIWDIDLDDLPVKMLPEESLEKLRNNDPFIAEVAGYKIQFRLTTGADEKKGAKFLKGLQQRIVDVLNLRIVAVEGVEGKDKRKWLDDLELRDHRDMLDAFDEHDGGIETEIEVECPSCGHIFPIDLPFGREFFLPRRRRKGSSDKATT